MQRYSAGRSITGRYLESSAERSLAGQAPIGSAGDTAMSPYDRNDDEYILDSPQLERSELLQYEDSSRQMSSSDEEISDVRGAISEIRGAERYSQKSRYGAGVGPQNTTSVNYQSLHTNNDPLSSTHVSVCANSTLTNRASYAGPLTKNSVSGDPHSKSGLSVDPLLKSTASIAGASVGGQISAEAARNRILASARDYDTAMSMKEMENRTNARSDSSILSPKSASMLSHQRASSTYTKSIYSKPGQRSTEILETLENNGLVNKSLEFVRKSRGSLSPDIMIENCLGNFEDASMMSPEKGQGNFEDAAMMSPQLRPTSADSNMPIFNPNMATFNAVENDFLNNFGDFNKFDQNQNVSPVQQEATTFQNEPPESFQNFFPDNASLGNIGGGGQGNGRRQDHADPNNPAHVSSTSTIGGSQKSYKVTTSTPAIRASMVSVAHVADTNPVSAEFENAEVEKVEIEREGSQSPEICSMYENLDRFEPDLPEPTFDMSKSDTFRAFPNENETPRNERPRHDSQNTSQNTSLLDTSVVSRARQLLAGVSRERGTRSAERLKSISGGRDRSNGTRSESKLMTHGRKGASNGDDEIMSTSKRMAQFRRSMAGLLEDSPYKETGRRMRTLSESINDSFSEDDIRKAMKNADGNWHGDGDRQIAESDPAMSKVFDSPTNSPGRRNFDRRESNASRKNSGRLSRDGVVGFDEFQRAIEKLEGDTMAAAGLRSPSSVKKSQSQCAFQPDPRLLTPPTRKRGSSHRDMGSSDVFGRRERDRLSLLSDVNRDSLTGRSQSAKVFSRRKFPDSLVSYDDYGNRQPAMRNLLTPSPGRGRTKGEVMPIPNVPNVEERFINSDSEERFNQTKYFDISDNLRKNWRRRFRDSFIPVNVQSKIALCEQKAAFLRQNSKLQDRLEKEINSYHRHEGKMIKKARSNDEEQKIFAKTALQEAEAKLYSAECEMHEAERDSRRHLQEGEKKMKGHNPMSPNLLAQKDMAVSTLSRTVSHRSLPKLNSSPTLPGMAGMGRCGLPDGSRNGGRRSSSRSGLLLGSPDFAHGEQGSSPKYVAQASAPGRTLTQGVEGERDCSVNSKRSHGSSKQSPRRIPPVPMRCSPDASGSSPHIWARSPDIWVRDLHHNPYTYLPTLRYFNTWKTRAYRSQAGTNVKQENTGNRKWDYCNPLSSGAVGDNPSRRRSSQGSQEIISLSDKEDDNQEIISFNNGSTCDKNNDKFDSSSNYDYKTPFIHRNFSPISIERSGDGSRKRKNPKFTLSAGISVGMDMSVMPGIAEMKNGDSIIESPSPVRSRDHSKDSKDLPLETSFSEHEMALLKSAMEFTDELMLQNKVGDRRSNSRTSQSSRRGSIGSRSGANSCTRNRDRLGSLGSRASVGSITPNSRSNLLPTALPQPGFSFNLQGALNAGKASSKMGSKTSILFEEDEGVLDNIELDDMDVDRLETTPKMVIVDGQIGHVPTNLMFKKEVERRKARSGQSNINIPEPSFAKPTAASRKRYSEFADSPKKGLRLRESSADKPTLTTLKCSRNTTQEHSKPLRTIHSARRRSEDFGSTNCGSAKMNSTRGFASGKNASGRRGSSSARVGSLNSERVDGNGEKKAPPRFEDVLTRLMHKGRHTRSRSPECTQPFSTSPKLGVKSFAKLEKTLNKLSKPTASSARRTESLDRGLNKISNGTEETKSREKKSFQAVLEESKNTPVVDHGRNSREENTSQLRRLSVGKDDTPSLKSEAQRRAVDVQKENNQLFQAALDKDPASLLDISIDTIVNIQSGRSYGAVAGIRAELVEKGQSKPSDATGETRPKEARAQRIFDRLAKATTESGSTKTRSGAGILPEPTAQKRPSGRKFDPNARFCKPTTSSVCRRQEIVTTNRGRSPSTDLPPFDTKMRTPTVSSRDPPSRRGPSLQGRIIYPIASPSPRRGSEQKESDSLEKYRWEDKENWVSAKKPYGIKPEDLGASSGRACGRNREDDGGIKMAIDDVKNLLDLSSKSGVDQQQISALDKNLSDIRQRIAAEKSQFEKMRMECVQNGVVEPAEPLRGQTDVASPQHGDALMASRTNNESLMATRPAAYSAIVISSPTTAARAKQWTDAETIPKTSEQMYRRHSYSRATASSIAKKKEESYYPKGTDIETNTDPRGSPAERTTVYGSPLQASTLQSPDGINASMQSPYSVEASPIGASPIEDSKARKLKLCQYGTGSSGSIQAMIATSDSKSAVNSNPSIGVSHPSAPSIRASVSILQPTKASQSSVVSYPDASPQNSLIGCQANVGSQKNLMVSIKGDVCSGSGNYAANCSHVRNSTTPGSQHSNIVHHAAHRAASPGLPPTAKIGTLPGLVPIRQPIGQASTSGPSRGQASSIPSGQANIRYCSGVGNKVQTLMGSVHGANLSASHGKVNLSSSTQGAQHQQAPQQVQQQQFRTVGSVVDPVDRAMSDFHRRYGPGMQVVFVRKAPRSYVYGTLPVEVDKNLRVRYGSQGFDIRGFIQRFEQQEFNKMTNRVLETPPNPDPSPTLNLLPSPALNNVRNMSPTVNNVRNVSPAMNTNTSPSVNIPPARKLSPTVVRNMSPSPNITAGLQISPTVNPSLSMGVGTGIVKVSPSIESPPDFNVSPNLAPGRAISPNVNAPAVRAMSANVNPVDLARSRLNMSPVINVGGSSVRSASAVVNQSPGLTEAAGVNASPTLIASPAVHPSPGVVRRSPSRADPEDDTPSKPAFSDTLTRVSLAPPPRVLHPTVSGVLNPTVPVQICM